MTSSVLLVLSGLAMATPPPCGTADRFADAAAHTLDPTWALPAALGPRGHRPAAEPARRGVTKTVRDAYGTFPHQAESDNFVLKWGVDSDITAQDAALVLDGFERSWTRYIDEWSYAAPASTDTFKFNAYVGDTGSGTPSDEGAAGYYWFDPDEYPMIVITRSMVEDGTAAEYVVAHEFFHAAQDATGAFEYDDVSGWWWEATAVWAEHEVYPENTDWAAFLYFFAVRPELWIGAFEYPTTGATEEYHQYGAFVYVSHLTERHGGPGLVHDTFTRSRTSTATPMTLVDDLLTERGDAIDDSFGDFAARNATWDYPTESGFESWVDAYQGAEPDEHRPSGVILRQTAGPVSPPLNQRPHTFGANYWRLAQPAPVTRITFQGDPGPRWQVAVASQTGPDHTTTWLPMAANTGIIVLNDLDLTDESWIVVAATDAVDDTGEAWSYSLDVAAIVPPVVVPEEPRACGCATPASPSGLPMAGLFVALGLARRRRPCNARDADRVHGDMSPPRP